ncbi:suppressor of fused domain protein [Haloferula sp.]|uniref:suppressor of fused domain protein n=1 Tax=Haloferula sp. TaxID=2497595 RepID=UPI003C751919
MTEAELLSHIEDGTGVPAKRGHPTYYDAGGPIHPTVPVDYDEERLTAVGSVLGEPDFTYHPALGLPHIDLHRYPATVDRPFTCYVTSGMSDFPTILRDGSSIRVELVACTARGDYDHDINSPGSISMVMRYASLYPFLQQTGINYYHVIELPQEYHPYWGKRVLLIPPFLLNDLAFLPLKGQKVHLLGMIRISDNDFSVLTARGPEALFESWRETLETWLFDTENRAPFILRSIQPPPVRKPLGLLGRLFGRK